MARVIVQNAPQVIPSPTDDLEVGEVRLPQLVHSHCRMPEAVRGSHHDVAGTRNQIVALEGAVDAGFRDKIALCISDKTG